MIAPRLIEICFQTSGVWEMGIEGRMGLPLRIDKVEVLGAREQSEERLYALVTPHPQTSSFDAEIVDANGNCYLRMRGYRTAPIPDSIDSQARKQLQAAMSLEPVAA